MNTPSYDQIQSNRHISESSTNYTRYENLKNSGEYGWAVVLLFYSALHLVEAYKCIHHPSNKFSSHSQRDDYVFEKIRSINQYYYSLSSMSRSVRYDLYDCKPENLQYAHGEYNVLWIEMQKLGITY